MLLSQAILWGTIIWSEIGKQNLQAENVYCRDIVWIVSKKNAEIINIFYNTIYI